MNFVLICCVQNVESCERMLGLEVGPARPSLLLNVFASRARARIARSGAARSWAGCSREDLGPSHFVTTAGQISRTLKTRARARSLYSELFE